MKSRADKILDGLWMVGDGRLSHPKDACAYLVDGGSETALIDTGAGENPEAILRNIEAVSDAANLKWILITHCHIDHVGGIPYLRRKTGAKVMCHAKCAEILAIGNDSRTAAKWYGMSLEPITVDATFDGPSETVKFGNSELTLLHTPGHSPDSTSIYGTIAEKKVLFGQDIHGPFSPVLGSNIELWKASMQRLIELCADILCEGHYGVVRGQKEVERFIRSFLEEHA